MIHNAWATPIEHKKSHVEGLLDYILTYSDTSKINYNILDDDSKPINLLKQIAYDNFKSYVNRCYGVDIDTYHTEIKGWLISPKDGYVHPFHNHMGAMFSSVFYVLAEENDSGGEIRFHDPRHNANRGYDENFAKHFKDKVILPKTDDVVIFPSFLYHSVSPFYSGLRIALPLDIMLIRRKD